MIAKRIARNKGTSSPARLVRYMVAAKGSLNPSSWARTADYILDTSVTTTKGERVGSYRVSNCGTDDPAAATVLIEATQAANTRSKIDKTYHLVYSFLPGEQPDLEILHAIEDQLCAAIGYADHHRVSAVHTDTDHLHVHVAINKVHPTGLQSIEPYFDKKKLMEACERLEIQYGLQRTNHGIANSTQGEHQQVPEQTDQPASIFQSSGHSFGADIEAKSGVETLMGYVARVVAPELRNASNWQQAHLILSEHGLELKQRGAGLVIGDPSASLWTKASNCGRDLSLKALTDRFGVFQSLQQRTKKRPDQAYKPSPKRANPAANALFTHYQQERQRKITLRRDGLAQIKQDDLVFKQQLHSWRNTQRLLAKAAGKGVTQKVMTSIIKQQADASLSAHRQAISEQRQSLFAQTATPAWADWLAQQAEWGNSEALTTLRSKNEREHRWRGDLLTAERADAAKIVVMTALQPASRKDGTMAYRTIDGGMVIDRKTHVHAQKATAGAAMVALELAAQKFPEQALIVEGSANFKHDLLRLAKLHRLNICFADATLEQARLSGESRVENNTRNFSSIAVNDYQQSKMQVKSAEQSDSVTRWIEERRKKQDAISSIPYHRLWVAADAGIAIYQGLRRMDDGTEVLLLKRNDEILVKPSSTRVVAKAMQWKLGHAVQVDARGRFIEKNNENEL